MMNADIISYQILNVMLISCDMIVFTCCLDVKSVHEGNRKGSYKYNETATAASFSLDKNQTNVIQGTTDIWNGNYTNKHSGETNKTVTEKIRDTSQKDHIDTQLPIPLMVASPAVAVGIFIFICVAYKWHAAQLDAQAIKLAEQVMSGECSSPCIPCSPCHTGNRLLPPGRPTTSTSPCHSDSDIFETRRKSLGTPSPVLLVPPRLASHRGSTWSAISDQEVISHSPRRHSTFLL